MADQEKPQNFENRPNSSSSSSTSSSPDSKVTPEPSNTNSNYSGQKVRYPNPPEHSYIHTNTNYSGQKVRFPNPPDSTNPDPATLREQWRFAIKQYSRWYSHAWGTAILAGLSFFALGWIIKGSNPLPSFKGDSHAPSDGDGAADSHNAK